MACNNNTECTPAEWAQTCLRSYIDFSRKAGLTVGQISTKLMHKSIDLLSEEQLQKMHDDPRIARAIITKAMRHVADELDGVSAPRIN